MLEWPVDPSGHSLFKMDNQTTLQRAGRIEELIGQLEASADPQSLAVSRELVQSLMDLYGAGLDRLTEIIARKGQAGMEMLDELGRDELVGNLLAANGLHPVDLEARVRRALDKLSARAHAQGTLEILSIDDGVIRLSLRPTASGCGSTGGSFKSAVEEAVYGAAPDLARLEIEVQEPEAAGGFVPLEKLLGHPAGAAV